MNCLIVDDDIFSTRLIAEFIKRTSTNNLINTFTNAIDAVDFMSVTCDKIDIIFLDIEMPEMSGIDFMKAVETHNTQIIIYSSQEKYALESYEYNVCDYLLKPVTYPRFLKALTKARIAIMASSAMPEEITNNEDKLPSTTEEDLSEDNEVYIKDNTNATYKVRYSDVIYIEASENYVTLVTTTRQIMIHTTMKSFLEKFPEKYVVKTHRSYAVGIRFIRDIIDNEISLLLTDKKIPIGKSFRDVTKNILTTK